jgi:hypothetical protein
VSGHYRQLKPEEKAILDQLSRATDPTKETMAQLVYQLETSAIAREAFAAEVFRLRALRDECHGNKSRLPKPVREELERACPKTKSFDHLMSLAAAGLAPEPELDPIN